jgi:hypothetical protein
LDVREPIAALFKPGAIRDTNDNRSREKDGRIVQGLWLLDACHPAVFPVSTHGTDWRDCVGEDFRLIVTAKE